MGANFDEGQALFCPGFVMVSQLSDWSLGLGGKPSTHSLGASLDSRLIGRDIEQVITWGDVWFGETRGGRTLALDTSFLNPGDLPSKQMSFISSYLLVLHSLNLA